MSYEIKPVALDDPELSEQIVELLRSAFGGQVDLASLKRNTTTGAAQPSLYLAAIEDGEVIGFNAFISHELLFDGRTISCFQSCWTATSPAHRGKRISRPSSRPRMTSSKIEVRRSCSAFPMTVRIRYLRRNLAIAKFLH